MCSLQVNRSSLSSVPGLCRIDKAFAKKIQSIKLHNSLVYVIVKDKDNNGDEHRKLMMMDKFSNMFATLHQVKHLNEMETLRDVQIKDIACGKRHTLILTQLGAVYGHGSNIWGQLGIDTKKTASNVKTLRQVFEEGFVSVKAGTDHSMALDEHGQVFGFGSALSHRLGTGDFKNVYTPKCIEELKGHKVVAIEAGDCHSMALTNKGRVFVWGGNMYKQTGLPDNKNIARPTEFCYQDQRFQNIAAGGAHSLFLTCEGKVLVAGHNIDNHLQELPLPADYTPSAVYLISYKTFLAKEDSKYLCGLALVDGHRAGGEKIVYSCLLGGATLSPECHQQTVVELMLSKAMILAFPMIDIVDHNTDAPMGQTLSLGAVDTAPPTRPSTKPESSPSPPKEHKKSSISSFESLQSFLPSLEQQIIELEPAAPSTPNQSNVSELISFPFDDLFGLSSAPPESTSTEPKPTSNIFDYLSDLDPILGNSLLDDGLFSPAESLARAVNNADRGNILNESRVRFVFDNGHYIHANSVLLIVYSNVFRQKFEGEWKHRWDIELKGECYQAYLTLITYIYTGDAELDKLSLEQLVALINLAYSVDARPDLIDKCAHQLARLLKVDNCIDIFTSVRKLEDDGAGTEGCIRLYDSLRRLEQDKGIALKGLKDTILNFIAKNFAQVILTDDFVKHNSAYLLEINQFVSKQLSDTT